MMSSANKSPVQLKGSIDIVVEFFEYGINHILYQRGLYSPNSFMQCEKYGMTVFKTVNKELKRYIDTILSQMRKFLVTKNVHKIVLVIQRLSTREPVERWQFDVQLERVGQEAGDCGENFLRDPEQDRRALKAIQEDIGTMIRQITASVTFLPKLEGSHSFDILLYTDKDVDLPNSEWSDTNAQLIQDGQHVQLRGFTTNVHKVEPIVSYMNRD